jgi:hypothetical protein
VPATFFVFGVSNLPVAAVGVARGNVRFPTNSAAPEKGGWHFSAKVPATFLAFWRSNLPAAAMGVADERPLRNAGSAV